MYVQQHEHIKKEGSFGSKSAAPVLLLLLHWSQIPQKQQQQQQLPLLLLQLYGSHRKCLYPPK